MLLNMGQMTFLYMRIVLARYVLQRPNYDPLYSVQPHVRLFRLPMAYRSMTADLYIRFLTPPPNI